MRLIDADWLKSEKVYSHERHEYVVPVYTIDHAPTISPKPDTNEVEKTIKKDEDEFFNNIGKYLKACRKERGEDI